MLAGLVSRFVVRRTLALSLVLTAGAAEAQVSPPPAPAPVAPAPAAPPPDPAPAPQVPAAPPAAPPPAPPPAAPPPAPPVVSEPVPVAPAPAPAPPPPAAPAAPAPVAPPPAVAPAPIAPAPVAPVYAPVAPAPVAPPPSPMPYAPVSPAPAPGTYAPAPQPTPPAYTQPVPPAYAQPAPAPYATPAPYAAPAPYPYPGAQPYPPSSLPPGYTLPPPAFPISDLPYAQQPAPAPKPTRNYARRLLLELGGTVHYGKVEHYVDGEFVTTHGDPYSDHSLHGAFDFRLGLQRRFGRWFALAGQFAWSNWQSDFLHSTQRRRSNYVGLVVQPEVRIPFGRCRNCPSLFFAPRAGLGLSMRGLDSRHHSALEEVHVGSAFLYGLRGGLEFPFGARVSLRLSTGFEAVWLRNRVEYQGLGSEIATVRVERPSTMLGFSIGLGDGT